MPEPEGSAERAEQFAGRSPRASARFWEAGIVLVSAACVITVATNWHSPIRVGLAVIFLLLIPGLSVAELLEIDDLVYRLTIATGVSLAADSGVALVLFYARAWSVGLAFAILLTLSAVTLAAAAMRARRRSNPAR